MIVEMQQGRKNYIGRLGENEARTARFLVRDVLFEHPDAAITVLNKRPGDANAYPVPSESTWMEGVYLYWKIGSGDLAKKGDGECELVATENGAICKSVYYKTEIGDALDGSGTVPDPWTGWVEQVTDAADRAEAAAEHGPRISGTTGNWETWDSETGAYVDTGNPSQGEQGDPGEPGKDGADGAPGEPGAPGKDGKDGEPGKDGTDGKDGADGQDGYSPTITVTDITGGHRLTITDANGTRTVDVMDGQDGTPGDPTALIDDTAGEGTTNRTWSADKLTSALNSKQDAPASGATAGKVLGLTEVSNELVPTWVSQPSVPVQDVQVNGVSVLSQGVANVPVANDTTIGVVKVRAGTDGLKMDSSNNICTASAPDSSIKSGINAYRQIVPANQHTSVFYALAKLAGADMASVSGDTVGVYPEAQKVAIQKMLGIYQAPWELIREDTVTNATEADIEITVDGNGNAFELTDVYLEFWLPTQETDANVGNYGRIDYYYGSVGVLSTYHGVRAQAANGNPYGTFALIKSDNGAILKVNGNYNTMGTDRVAVNAQGRTNEQKSLLIVGNYTFSKVKIRSITGTGSYKLYGKRKWTV